MNIWDKLVFKFGIFKRNLNNFIIDYKENRNQLPEESLPLVADLGGCNKGEIRTLAGFGKVKIITVNLYDDADVKDDAATLESIADESLDGIYLSHVIEHFWWYEIHDILKLWYKKLKPNGRIEIRCPDVESAFKKSLKFKNSVLWEDVLLHHIYGGGAAPWHKFYQHEGMYHKNVFWKKRLQREMEAAGFKKVKRIRYFFPGMDRWKYNLRYKDFHDSFYVTDLVMEGYKK